MHQNPIKHYYRLKKPCGNCPFLKTNGIELRPGRVKGIAQQLMKDDDSTFTCHKTVHSPEGGQWDNVEEEAEGKYIPSGHEAMCAGAAAYLMVQRRPTIGMRMAFAFKDATPTDWDGGLDLIMDCPPDELP